MRSVNIGYYTIYENGQIFSNKYNKFLKHIKHEYPLVDLYVNGIRKRHFVHRLLAENFIENPYNKPYVNHKDGNKYNNELSNLEWVTHQENIKHCWDNGLHKNMYKGKKVICELTGKIFESVKKAAEEYKYNHRVLCNMLNDKNPQKNCSNLKYI